MKTFTILSFLFLFVFIQPGNTQNSFSSEYFYTVAPDDQAFFFQPSQISPYQAGVFGEVMNQYAGQPVSAINRNPAEITSVSQNFFYIDVNTLPDADLANPLTGCPFCISPGFIVVPSTTQQQVQEPFLSAAMIINPLENSSFRIGFTYQLMNQDQQYYNVRSGQFGNIFFSSMAGLSSSDDRLPVPDGPEVGERDQFRKAGHFPTLYAGYRFSDRISGGIKVGYNHYSGSGDQLQEFQPTTIQSTVPPERFNRQRDTGYSHWDFSAGIRAAMTDRSTVGLQAGFLTGSFAQDGRNTAFQGIRNFNFSDPEAFYTMDSRFLGRDDFDRSGNTIYGRTDYQLLLNSRSQLNISYRISYSNQNYRYGSSELSFMETESLTTNNQGQSIYQQSDTERTTLADGNGEASIWQHQGGALWNREMGNSFHLRTGFQLRMHLDLDSFSERSQTVSDDFRYREEDGETVQDLNFFWDSRDVVDHDVDRYRFTGYLPFMLGKSFGSRFSAELGVMGFYQSEITRQNRFQQNEQYRLEREDDEVTMEDLTRSDFESDSRDRVSQAFLNMLGSLTYSPANQVSLQFSAFSDRRQINTISSVDAVRFQLSAEVSF